MNRSRGQSQSEASSRVPSTGEPGRAGGLEVRSKLWLEIEGKAVLGDWRTAILEGIERTGSLARAAEELGTPYRTAWQRLKESEERLGFRLVETQSGGADGGRSVLTEEARDLLRRYRQFSEGLEELVNQRFKEAFG